MNSRLLPGEGAIPVGALIDRVLTSDPDAFIGIEVFSDDLNRLPLGEAAARARASMREVMAVVPGRLEGKVALITGAAMGQGAAEARLFAEHGARVAVTDIADTGDVALGARGPRPGPVPRRDRKRPSGPVPWRPRWRGSAAWTSWSTTRGSGSLPAPSGDEEMEHHYKVWAVNADGVYLGIRAVAPVMSAQGAGSIVNISSIDGLDGVAGMMSYTASKFAVTGMTRTAALELGAQGIRVNSIHPGVIATPMLDAAPPETLERLQRVLDRQPIPRMGTAEEVAYLALYLASDESSYCTGAQFVIDGGHLAGPYREGYGPDDGALGLGGRLPVAGGAVQRLGVDLRDDVLPEEPDGLQGGLEVARRIPRRRSGRSRRPPSGGTARAPRRGRPRWRHPRRPCPSTVARSRSGMSLGPVRDAFGVGEGVVVAEHVALQVVELGVEAASGSRPRCPRTTKAAVVTITLSLTKAPIGSALAMAFLYVSRTASRSGMEPTEKPSTPRPLRAAIS